jgi:RNA polymerase subunit RPABC4/transcription elongation factor Spt4
MLLQQFLRGVLRMKVERCVRCRYMPEEKDKYCIRCGAPLINRCTDQKGLVHKGCNKVNRVDAAYCADCGSPTTFNLAGLVRPYW